MPADPAAGTEWVAGQAEAHPALAERYAKLSDLCTRKLWHQLTDEVSSFVNDPACQAAGADLAELYGSFVKTFETKAMARFIFPCMQWQQVVARSSERLLVADFSPCSHIY